MPSLEDAGVQVHPVAATCVRYFDRTALASVFFSWLDIVSRTGQMCSGTTIIVVRFLVSLIVYSAWRVLGRNRLH